MRKILFLIFILFLFFLIARTLLPKTIIIPLPSAIASPSPSVTTTPSSPETAKVKRVIDGDTIELADGQRVRYIGIDTPELRDPRKGTIQCYAQEAKNKNKELVEGKTVQLEKDVSETDRFGRLLRYVFIDNNQSTPSSVFINEYLVKEGYAYAATFPPDVKYADLFLKTQSQARNQNKGLWKECK